MRVLVDRILAGIQSARARFGKPNLAVDGESYRVAISSKTLGTQGEQAAATYLQKRGYRILHRNYRIARGEIDLVADHQGTLVFVEVKARRSTRFGSPSQAVDCRKQERLIHVATHYLHRYQCEDRQCRFDVILLTQQSSSETKIELIQNAFELDGS